MPEYFELEVSLMRVERPLRRRFLINADLTFADLHEAIQDACGWSYSHLYAFYDAGRKNLCGPPDGGSAEVSDEDLLLKDYFDKHASCTYVYDFGDEWQHLIDRKGTVTLKEDFDRRLLGGEGVFPPDDCGGTWGYEQLYELKHLSGAELAKLDEEDRDEAEGLLEWAEDWDPDSFDLEAARKQFDR